jgi:3-oxoacyl-[acyl-carrier protein] reductase
VKIANKTAIVTGAANGLGRLIAQRLHEAGARVVALDLDVDGLTALGKELPGSLTRVCDVGDPDQVKESVDAVFEEVGALDILVNNAGIIRSAPLLNLLSRDDRKHSVDLWNTVIQTNLSSVFHMTVNVADKMVKNRTKGVIVNISSICAAGNAGQSAYSAAKAGVNALTVTWAKEMGPLGIRVNAIAPGFIDTPSTRKSVSDNVLSSLEKEIPLRRLGSADNVVSAILAVVENEYIQGAIVPIDGGLRI